jgi:hypothetical protein
MQRRVPVLIAAVSAATLAFVPAFGGQGGTTKLTLHPDGFGPNSYAAWKAQQGEADATGGASQALYFQKMTATTTNAAGVAEVEGVEGMSPSDVGQLAFDWRTDGHCGGGAPRFNLTVENGGTDQTIFFGCMAMQDEGQKTDDQGRTWDRRSVDISNVPGTIVSLSIVFDEGNDVGQGFVYLDNIQVGNQTWTGPADNGAGQA